MIAAYAQRARPNFPFTSVQININYASSEHVDENNLGATLITGLGPYKAGQLFVADQYGNINHKLTKGVRGHQQGQVVRGYNVDLASIWFEFDGNVVHFTRPFTGSRCTLTYFVCDEFLKAPPALRIELGNSGFAFVWSNPQLQMMMKSNKNDDKRDEGKEEPCVVQTLAAARKATILLLGTNSNKPGGGGMAMYHQRFKALRKILATLPEPSRQQALTVLDASNCKTTFEGKTPSSWRKFLPSLLKMLKAPARDIHKASTKANPKGLSMSPVRRALQRAKVRSRWN